MEIWKAVVGYEGLYEVSSLGRVRSLDRVVKNRYSWAHRRGKVLSPASDRAGYLQVRLSAGNVQGTGKVHRMVADAFLGPRPASDSHVNHKDFVKDNNFFKNLEWCTSAENLRHAVLAGRFDGSVRPRRGKKLNTAKARSIKDARAAGESCKSIALRFAIAPQTVLRIVNGNIWLRA